MIFYLVKSDKDLSEHEIKKYYDCIEKIGYRRTTCHVRDTQTNGSIKLKDAEGGLLETELDAKRLLQELEKAMPDHKWQIVEKWYDEEITWYRHSEA